VNKDEALADIDRALAFAVKGEYETYHPDAPLFGGVRSPLGATTLRRRESNRPRGVEPGPSRLGSDRRNEGVLEALRVDIETDQLRTFSERVRADLFADPSGSPNT
jgi:hypothetical protein